MKYIDGIKNNEMSNTWFGEFINQSFIGLSELTIRKVKHIPIYEPMTEERILYLTSANQSVIDIKWIDGQPYELITWSKD